ncbi:MAG TPA: peptidylprolyl isomerase [Polyangiaceae bacterium]|nr:peptidylprolyl isomerase [Polyangiaceae bacterium]
MTRALRVASLARHAGIASTLTLLACTGAGDGAPSASGSASAPVASSASAAADAGAPAERLLALREAEQRRAASLVGEPDLSDRAVAVRRQAARALARIGSDASRAMLLRMLSDEDPEVVEWAAYGLGFRCAEAKEATVAALVARAIALPEDAALDGAAAAIARAVGRCAAPTSEATLVAWLDAPPVRARAAALGRGDLAQRTKRLREDTLVALLGKAAGGVSAPALPEALYPFFRLENVPPSVQSRLAEVASARLSEAGPYRIFAVRAFGRAQAAGIGGLERVLIGGDASFTVPERVEAVRAALRLGQAGHVLLTKTLKKLPATGEAIARADADVAVLLALLGTLRETTAIVPELRALAGASAPPDASPRQRRVVSLVRCAAATLVAGDKPSEPLLVGCDPEHGFVGKRAMAAALSKSKMEAPELKVFRELVSDTDPRVREAALEIFAVKPDIPGAHDVVVAALRAAEPGVVTVAAEQIQKQPSLASERKPPKKPPPGAKGGKKGAAPPKDDKADEELPPPSKVAIDALTEVLSRGEREHDLEMIGAAIDAFGALGQKTLASKSERFCQSADPTAREHAKSAITLMTGKKPTCDGPLRADEIAPEALVAARGPLKLVFESDAGKLEMTLDPSIAPVTVARLADLVRSGFYDGKIIHRVDPSFVVQFGAPFGDGYGGPPERTALRCETSPRAFEPMSVGVALAGRDTGSSQLFVMRSRAPHLDGDYPEIGTASGPWDTVFEGDAITKARVED